MWGGRRPPDANFPKNSRGRLFHIFSSKKKQIWQERHREPRTGDRSCAPVSRPPSPVQPAISARFKLLDQQLYVFHSFHLWHTLRGSTCLTLPQKAASLANASLPSFNPLHLLFGGVASKLSTSGGGVKLERAGRETRMAGEQAGTEARPTAMTCRTAALGGSGAGEGAGATF